MYTATNNVGEETLKHISDVHSYK